MSDWQTGKLANWQTDKLPDWQTGLKRCTNIWKSTKICYLNTRQVQKVSGLREIWKLNLMNAGRIQTEFSPTPLFIFYELQTSQSQKPFQTNIIFICARLFHYFSLCLVFFFGKTIKTFAALGCILSELSCECVWEYGIYWWTIHIRIRIWRRWIREP